jgi:DNA polymerase I
MPDQSLQIVPPAGAPPAFPVRLVRPGQVRFAQDTEEARRSLAAMVALPAAAPWGIDLETTGLDPLVDRVRLVQLAHPAGPVLVIDAFAVPSSVELLTSRLAGTSLVAHHAQFEARFLLAAGFAPSALHCTALLYRAALSRPRPIGDCAGKGWRGGMVSLAQAAREILQVDLDKTEQLADWSSPVLTAAQVAYAADDAVATMRLAQALLPSLASSGAARSYKLLRLCLLPVARMELRGFAIDQDRHRRQISLWEAELQQISARWEAIAPGVSPGSTPQLSAWLAEKLPPYVTRAYGNAKPASLRRGGPWPRTANGQLSTASATLEVGEQYIPELAVLRELRAVAKQLQAFGPTLLEKVSPTTGAIHPRYRLAGAVTGRMACSEPNLQQIPSSKKAPHVRQHFIARPGHVLVLADFAQAELRVIAALSGDAALIAALSSGEDLHSVNAAFAFRVPLEQITKDDYRRTLAKSVAFGIAYGQGAPAIAERFGLPLAMAQQAVDGFLSRFPTMATWFANQASTATAGGMIRTIGGLARNWLPPFHDGYIAGEAQNFAIQGTAADLLHATVALLPLPYRDQLVALVHDELLLEVPVNDGPAAAKALEHAMRSAWLLLFPDRAELAAGLAEADIGPTWAEAKGSKLALLEPLFVLDGDKATKPVDQA